MLSLEQSMSLILYQISSLKKGLDKDTLLLNLSNEHNFRDVDQIDYTLHKLLEYRQIDYKKVKIVDRYVEIYYDNSIR